MASVEVEATPMELLENKVGELEVAKEEDDVPAGETVSPDTLEAEPAAIETAVEVDRSEGGVESSAAEDEPVPLEGAIEGEIKDDVAEEKPVVEQSAAAEEKPVVEESAAAEEGAPDSSALPEVAEKSPLADKPADEETPTENDAEEKPVVEGSAAVEEDAPDSSAPPEVAEKSRLADKPADEGAPTEDAEEDTSET